MIQAPEVASTSKKIAKLGKFVAVTKIQSGHSFALYIQLH